jgi:hypothetical protein
MLTYSIAGNKLWKDINGMLGWYASAGITQASYSTYNNFAVTRDGKNVIVLEGLSNPGTNETLFGGEPPRFLKSNDYGKTFVVSKFPFNTVSVTNIFISFNGQYQTVTTSLINPYNGQGPVYVSSDFGNTWTQTSLLNREWTTGAMSSTGQYQLLGGFGTNVYISTDFGASWQIAPLPVGGPNDFATSLNISDNGTVITIGIFDFGSGIGRLIRTNTNKT